MYRIEILAEGGHHNGTSDDADMLARALVGALRQAGHVVHRAEFIPAGGVIEDVAAPEAPAAGARPTAARPSQRTPASKPSA